MLRLWFLISSGLFPVALPSSHTIVTQTAVTDISGWRERLERLHVVLQQDIAQEHEVHLKHSAFLCPLLSRSSLFCCIFVSFSQARSTFRRAAKLADCG